MRNWPNWIPSPNAWMSALLLVILMRGLALLINTIVRLGDFLLVLPPKWRGILYIVALLSPILLIAITHHLLHLILDRFSPDSQSPEMRDVQGFLPSLMSWWEGFFGWQAIALALLVSNGIQLIFAPRFVSLDALLDWWNFLKSFFTISNLIRLVTIAYLYQFESLVRDRLISVGAANRSNQS